MVAQHRPMLTYRSLLEAAAVGAVRLGLQPAPGGSWPLAVHSACSQCAAECKTAGAPLSAVPPAAPAAAPAAGQLERHLAAALPPGAGSQPAACLVPLLQQLQPPRWGWWHHRVQALHRCPHCTAPHQAAKLLLVLHSHPWPLLLPLLPPAAAAPHRSPHAHEVEGAAECRCCER